MENIKAPKVNLPLIGKLALRYTFCSKGGGPFKAAILFALFGVALGVFLLILVASVMRGFRSELISSLISSSGEIVVSNLQGDIRDYTKLCSTISSLPEVKNAEPVISCWTLAQCGGRASCLPLTSSESDSIPEGSALISRYLSRTLKCKEGDKLILNDLTLMLKGLSRPRVLKVTGILPKSSLDKHIVCSLKSAALIASKRHSISSIAISTWNPEEVDVVGAKITSLLPKGYYVSNWKEVHPEIINALEIERMAMFTILSMIIIVGALNCFSVFVMLVESKKREIAILKVMGLSSLEVILVFLSAGFLLGTSAALIGSIFACSLLANAERIKLMASKHHLLKPLEYFLHKLPLSIHWNEVLYVAAFSIIIALAATLYPAYKALKAEPASILNSNI